MTLGSNSLFARM